MKILLSSYSFGAYRGSEAGVGWNVACGMARRGHEVTVVTTSEFHDLNVGGLEKEMLPIRLLEWDFGLTVFASSRSYNHWQRSLKEPLAKLCGQERFDLIHHVTFNQYRGLRDVFYLNLPYVVGPIGGAETVASVFLKELPLKARLKEILRKIPFDVWYLGHLVRKQASRGIIMTSTPQTSDRLRRFAGIPDIELLPIISIHDREILDTPEHGERYFVFDGGTRPEKGLKLLIRALAKVWQAGYRFPLRIAAVKEEAKAGVLEYADAAGLPQEALDLMPFMKRDELLEIIRHSAAFVSVGFRDSGCMALLEGLALGVPAVCLDVLGQFWLPAEYAYKLPTNAHVEEAVRQALVSIAAGTHNQTPELLQRRAAWLHRTMTWDVRLDALENAYARAVELNRDGGPVRKVYVVTPTYNSLKWLPRCVRSVADQAAGRIEIHHHVQDGASTDGTPEWLERWKREHGNSLGYTFTYESARDKGMYDAINTGWDRTPDGTYIIAHLNSDEQYLPGALLQVVQEMERRPRADVLLGTYIIVDDQNRYVCHRRPVMPKAWSSWLNCACITNSSFYRAELFRRLKPRFNPNWKCISDLVFYRDLLCQRVRFETLPNLVTSLFVCTGSNLAWTSTSDEEWLSLHKDVPWLLRKCNGFIYRWVNLKRRIVNLYCRNPRSYSCYDADEPTPAKHDIPHPTVIWKR